MNDSIAHELKRENRLIVVRGPQSHGELFSLADVVHAGALGPLSGISPP
jgi:hypothetical protein